MFSEKVRKYLNEGYSLGDDKESFDVWDKESEKLKNVCDYLKDTVGIDFTNIDVEHSQDGIYSASFMIKGLPESSINDELEQELYDKYVSGYNSYFDGVQLENWGGYGPICILVFDIGSANSDKYRFGKAVQDVINTVTKNTNLNESDDFKNVVLDSYKHITEELGKDASVSDIYEDILNNYDSGFINDDSPEAATKDYNNIKYILNREGLKYLDETEDYQQASDIEEIKEKVKNLYVKNKDGLYPNILYVDNKRVDIDNSGNASVWKDGKLIGSFNLKESYNYVVNVDEPYEKVSVYQVKEDTQPLYLGSYSDPRTGLMFEDVELSHNTLMSDSGNKSELILSGYATCEDESKLPEGITYDEGTSVPFTYNVKDKDWEELNLDIMFYDNNDEYGVDQLYDAANELIEFIIQDCKKNNININESARKLKESTLDVNEVSTEYKDAYGKDLNLKNVPCVIAKDKFLSGWGQAQDKTCYIVVLCGDSTEAANIESHMSSHLDDLSISRVRLSYGVKTPRGSVVSYCVGKNAPTFNGTY